MGINPVQYLQAYGEEEDPEFEGHRLMRFEDYGVDEVPRLSTHQPKDSDPYVEVGGVLDHAADEVVQLLSNQDIVSQLLGQAGPHWPPPFEDHGIGRYQRMVRSIEVMLGMNTRIAVCDR